MSEEQVKRGPGRPKKELDPDQVRLNVTDQQLQAQFKQPNVIKTQVTDRQFWDKAFIASVKNLEVKSVGDINKAIRLADGILEARNNRFLNKD